MIRAPFHSSKGLLGFAGTTLRLTITSTRCARILKQVRMETTVHATGPYYVLSEAICEMFPRKTLKMVDQPSIDELNTQLGLLRTWLPLMA